MRQIFFVKQVITWNILQHVWFLLIMAIALQFKIILDIKIGFKAFHNPDLKIVAPG